jgi:hypothetical protein
VPYCEGSKAAVKRATYALVYGAGLPGIVRYLRAEYRAQTGTELPEAQASLFLSHPLVSEMLAARNAELGRIREAGYVVDCFGRTLVQGQMLYGDGIKRTVHGADAASSLLAQRAQAREEWLMEPLIGLAETEAAKGKDAEWSIRAWQHDGCSLHFRDGRPDRRTAHLDRITAAVAERADAAGYPTRLEVKHDPFG